jgi:hypothetical protein
MIRYIKGDATLPQGEGDKIILHIVNNRNGWGKGFVNSIDRNLRDSILIMDRYKSMPEYLFRIGHKTNKLGDVQFCPMETLDGTNLWVANMMAQDGYRSFSNPKPLSYVHLGRCLDQVRGFIEEMKLLGVALNVHCPKIGAGLGGGEWKLIANRLNVHLQQDITVYEL